MKPTQPVIAIIGESKTIVNEHVAPPLMQNAAKRLYFYHSTQNIEVIVMTECLARLKEGKIGNRYCLSFCGLHQEALH
jgi:hypothetical protein